MYYMSHKKNNSYFPLYWLFNFDPNNGNETVPTWLDSISSPIYPKQLNNCYF